MLEPKLHKTRYMSLNFHFGNVSDYKELHTDERQWSITEHLIWHCVAVQMGSITEKNWKQFAMRYFAYHRVNNTPEKGRVSVADIKRRIGLVTNVTSKTDTQFKKFLAEELLKVGERALRDAGELHSVC